MTGRLAGTRAHAASGQRSWLRSRLRSGRPVAWRWALLVALTIVKTSDRAPRCLTGIHAGTAAPGGLTYPEPVR